MREKEREREKGIVCFFPCGCPSDALIYKKQEGRKSEKEEEEE